MKKSLMNPGRRLFVDDALFVIALAIPALVAAARYVESDREMTALAKAHKARTTAVAKVDATERERIVRGPIAWGTQSATAQGSRTTP
jgi:hypothetical protein